MPDLAAATSGNQDAVQAGDPRYAKITEEEIRRATASGAHGGGSTEYDSAPLDAPPSTDRGLQPAALEAGYGGSDSVMNTAGARARSDIQRSEGGAADGNAAASNGARPGTGTGNGKGTGIKRSARQGSILAGFGGADAEA